MSYEHKLVYVGSVDSYLAEGWEPTPWTVPVEKKTYPARGHIIAMTYVWMRRVLS